MGYITWSDDFSVGVNLFDQDHQKLVQYVNKLHTGILTKEPVGAMMEILNGLIDYTAVHFKHEEDLMIEHDYPDYKSHKSEHDALVAKVLEFKDQLDSGKTSFSIQLMNFLRDWLMNHIKGSDMNYSSFFKDKGVS